MTAAPLADRIVRALEREPMTENDLQLEFGNRVSLDALRVTLSKLKASTTVMASGGVYSLRPQCAKRQEPDAEEPAGQTPEPPPAPPVEPDTKTCGDCHQELPQHEFGRSGGGGRRDICRKCHGRRIQAGKGRITPLPVTKRCASCGEQKPLADYTKNARSPDGLQSRCRACHNTSVRKAKGKPAIGGKPGAAATPAIETIAAALEVTPERVAEEVARAEFGKEDGELAPPEAEQPLVGFVEYVEPQRVEVTTSYSITIRDVFGIIREFTLDRAGRAELLAKLQGAV